MEAIEPVTLYAISDNEAGPFTDWIYDGMTNAVEAAVEAYPLQQFVYVARPCAAEDPATCDERIVYKILNKNI